MGNFKADFSVDRENKKITVKREFAAAVPLVWDAYTKSELLDQWWGPKPWNAKTKSMDFREGGQWLYSMVGPDGTGGPLFALVQYTHIAPQVSFTTRNGFSDSDGNRNTDMPQSTWVVSFAASGENTLVTTSITYDTPEALEMVLQMGFREGYSQGMDQLDKLLPTLQQ